MKNLIIRDGTSQKMRVLPALQDGYFDLDEMSFPDLLAMATEFAGVVKFFNMDNQPEGDWTPYFHADETIVMSRILAIDLDAAIARFDDWWRHTPERAGSDARAWRVHELPVAALARQIDGWFVALASSPNESGQRLCMLITSVIEQLCADKSSLTNLMVQSALAQEEANAENGGLALHPVWSGGSHASESASVSASGTVITKAVVRSNFYAFIKAIEMIRKEALLRLPESLISQHHDPAIGLLIAFIRQFQKLKTKLNRFTQNYLDFYYDKVLKSAPNKAVADSTFLVFEVNAPGREVRVARQTEFLAGLDANNRDIVYVSDAELMVNDAQVRALQTLFFDRNRYNSPENLLRDDDKDEVKNNDKTAQSGSVRRWPTAAWHNLLPVKSDYSNPDNMRSQPLFGAQKHTAQVSLFADARIGFALSSTVLLLKEGQRKVRVTLHLDDDLLARRIDRLIEVMDGNAASQSKAQAEIYRQNVFLKVFRHMFRIAVTAEKGWLDVPDYLPLHSEASHQGNWLSIEFELPPQAQSVVAYNPLLHGEQYDTAAPVVRFIVNPGAYLYPYGMLRNLPITGASIRVTVSGCRDLVLHNQIGQLSAAAPFAPFGPLPKIGSYLIVGSTEMAGKQIDSFGVDIKWADLPLISGGFGAYYRGYGVNLRNENFLATAAVLSKGAWSPPDAQAALTVPLFRTVAQPGQGEHIDSNIHWTCNSIAHQFQPDDTVSQDKPLTYSSSAKNGFFKFTLAAPAFAFGHEQYPQIMASALIWNASTKWFRTQRALPNPPYTPQIEAISISYRASASIRMDRTPSDGPGRDDKFIHLFPSGWEILGLSSYPAPALLPRFDSAGNLYIGIEAAELKGVITLFFHLREDSLPLSQNDSGSGETTLQWFYLTGNTWKELYANNIVSDSTQHFMTSGIVTLNLPSDISSSNTVMPDGLYWLRLSADNDLEKFCSVYSVYAQATQVRRRQDAPGDIPATLPAATITRGKKTIPGILKITQVIASSGGRPAETRAQLRTRLSERLRHKNRAVSGGDYESLILQQFPDAYKVKCFANMATDRGPADCVRPGHVLIVPLPYWPSVGRSDQMPMLNGNLIGEMQAFVQRRASLWSRISVQNPIYEQIQVCCQVTLREGLSGGYYINRLNDDISDFLTPWNDSCGYVAHFGWCIRQHDVEAFILSRDYVDNVTKFSMLRIVSADTYTFALSDTAAGDDGSNGGNAGNGNGGNDGNADITPQYPWSIAIPARKHAIEVIPDMASHKAAGTTLGQLEIGSTFIISAGSHDDK
jgi:hypothetical protein